MDNDNILEQWILPVYNTDERKSICGQCFIVGSYIVTAAHVIKEAYRPYILWGEDPLYLTLENAVVRHNASEDEDFAVFFFSPIKSNVLFGTINESIKDFTCWSFRKQREEEVLIHSSAQLTPTITDRAFICNVDPMLCEGDSGCPIINNKNEVIGMLVGSPEKEHEYSHICAFQNATYIKKILEQCLEN